MTRRQRRVHLVAWIILGPAVTALIVLAWPSDDSDPSLGAAAEARP